MKENKTIVDTAKNNPEKKRIVILMGAGAAVPFGGLLAADLTNYIINNSFFKNKSNENYLQFLQNLIFKKWNVELNENTQNSVVNFEILSYVANLLLEYFSNVNTNLSPTDGFIKYKSLFEILKEVELELPEIIYPEETPSGYTKSIERKVVFKSNPDCGLFYRKEGYEYSAFFLQIYNEIIAIIKCHVKDYSLTINKENNSRINLECFINFLLSKNNCCEFINKL